MLSAAGFASSFMARLLQRNRAGQGLCASARMKSRFIFDHAATWNNAKNEIRQNSERARR